MKIRIFIMAEDENRVTYEMIYELVRREKSREELQKLEENFLPGLLTFLREQDGRMLGPGSRSDLFAISERDQLMVQSQNTRRLVREIYERRERKIVDLAVNKSRTGSDLIDTSNLIAEEKALFDMLVTSLDAFRRGILGNVLALRDPERALLGSAMPSAAPVSSTSFGHKAISSDALSEVNLDHIEPTAPPSDIHVPQKDGFKKVRFVQPVEQFVGQELELYGPFQPGEEAELPTTVAEVLLAQKSAQPV